MMTPEVLTVDEVAAYLRIDRKTVYDAITAGTIPAARVGKSRAWRIRRRDVEALFAPAPSRRERIEVVLRPFDNAASGRA